MPRMILTYGFKGGQKFWFGKPAKTFWFPVPTHLGPKYEVVHYEANHIDKDVRFTKEAAMQLSNIPKPFLGAALKGIVAEAKKEGVTLVDDAFVKKLNEKRG